MRFYRIAAILLSVLMLSAGAASAQSGVRISSPLTANGGAFIHTVRTVGPDLNAIGNITQLVSEYPRANISPMTDGNKNVVIFATYNVTASSGTHQFPFGVYREGNNNWFLYNEHIATPMAHGAAFNVQVQSKSDSVFIHTAKAANTTGHITWIDHPLLNDNLAANFSVTPLWKGVYNNHFIGVYYENGHWSIFNQDLQPIPAGAKFNIHVLLNPETDFKHTATLGNIVSTSKTQLDHPLLNGNVGAQFIVTQNWTLGGIYNNHPIGVEYENASNRWRIINVDGAAMTAGAGFNIHITHDGDIYNDGAIYNGGFEAPAPGGVTQAAQWNSAAAGAGSKRVCNKYAPVSAAAKIFANTGECAFKLKGAVGETRKVVTKGFYNPDPAHNAVDLYVMLKKKGAGTLTVKAKVTLDDATKVSFAIPGIDINGAYDWKPVSQYHFLPAGKLPVKVKVVVKLSGGGKVFIDDVSSGSYTGAIR